LPNRPEPHLYATQNCAGIVARAALFSEGGWDAFLRRQLLRALSFAFGSSFILGQNQLAIAAPTAVQPRVSRPPSGAAGRDGIARGTEVEKVIGIGGFFFRAKDPKALWRWYQEHLGADAIELRGFHLAARGRTHRFRSSTGDERPFQGNRQALDVETFESGISTSWQPSYEPLQSQYSSTP
jgi:hypothetical protein